MNYEDLKVGEIVAQMPKAADVFTKLGIDYCCGGKVSFESACIKKGKNPVEVWEEINNLASVNSVSGLDFQHFEIGFLIDYIYNVHHVYLYENLPILDALVNKVVTKHHEKYVHLQELATLYSTLSNDLLGHLPKEENIIFPYGKSLLAASKAHQAPEAPFFGTVTNPIKVMHHEHDHAGDIIHRLREITNNYTPPIDACNSHIVMLAKLKELDADLIQHIHIENNILFPKIEQLEEALSITQ